MLRHWRNTKDVLEILNILLCVPAWMCRYGGGFDDLFDEMVCLEVCFPHICVFHDAKPPCF